MIEQALLGKTLGRFTLQSELGRGGMAMVYRAHQQDLNRDVALKILRPELALDQGYVARFTHEARSVAALDHPHIVPIYEVGSAELEGTNATLHYLAMKHITGTTLKQLVRQGGPLDILQACDLLDQVASAIDYAHRQGMIHRDIKPSNIMVTDGGWAYLTDFGLARSMLQAIGLTIDGAVLGTPEYMSPEQAEGRATIGAPTDIYSLGVVIYELLTGRMPFEAETPMGALVARLQRPPEPLRTHRGDLPLPVEQVVLRALARDPAERYPTASALTAALREAATNPVQMLSAATTESATQTMTAAVYTLNAAPALAAAAPGASGALLGGGRLLAAEGATIALAPPAAPPVATAPPPEKTRRRWGRRRIALAVAGFVLLCGIIGAIMGPNAQLERNLMEGDVALVKSGQVEKATDAYQRALLIDPNNHTALSRLALIDYLRGNYAEARDGAKAALQVDSDDASMQALLSQALTEQGDRVAALEAADRAIDMDEDLSLGYAVRATARAHLAAESFDAELLNQANDDIKQALSIVEMKDPLMRALVYSARGDVCWTQYQFTRDNKLLECTRVALESAREEWPSVAMFTAKLADLAQGLGSLDQAGKLYEEAIKIDGRYAPAYVGLGWINSYDGRYDVAQRYFNQALALSPYDTDAYRGRSFVALARQPADFDRASADLHKALEIAPRQTELMLELGSVWLQQGIALSDGSPQQQEAYRNAEEQFREALKLNGRSPRALTGLGRVLERQASDQDLPELYTSALQQFQEALKIAPQNTLALQGAGWTYLGMREYPNAEKAFRQAMHDDESAEVYLGLGRTLEAMGRTEEARNAYRTAILKGSPEARETLNRMR
ncbi:MAG TPA: protein kinase [Roseiflexaceae bacterium]|nr:protein kinase [Roseiflexaceae bacterium]